MSLPRCATKPSSIRDMNWSQINSRRSSGLYCLAPSSRCREGDESVEKGGHFRCRKCSWFIAFIMHSLQGAGPHPAVSRGARQRALKLSYEGQRSRIEGFACLSLRMIGMILRIIGMILRHASQSGCARLPSACLAELGRPFCLAGKLRHQRVLPLEQARGAERPARSRRRGTLSGNSS